VLRLCGGEISDDFIYPIGVNHGFMVRPNYIYKIKTRGDGATASIQMFLLRIKSKLLTELSITYFERDFPPKRLFSCFYYTTSSGIRKSSKFLNKNFSHQKISLVIAYLKKIKKSIITQSNEILQIIFEALKKRCSQIVMSRANSTLTLSCGVGRQENNILS
jgi:hypothetical protein